jgi:predicted DNA-binding protein (MmcQ/YjbR family)
MNASELRKLVSEWPGVTEDIKWGADLVYSVGGKMFAVTGAGAKDAGGVSFKVPDARFLELTGRPGIVPAPYLARARWVLVQRDARLAKAELAALIRGSYELVRAKLPLRVRRELGA